MNYPPSPGRPPASSSLYRTAAQVTGVIVAVLAVFGIGAAVGAVGANSSSTNSKSGATPTATVTVTATATAKKQPAPTVTATKTVKVTVTAKPDSGTGGSNSGGQKGIQFGYACSPVGALGTAEDGRPAECFMGKDGRARWGYDSDRG